MFILSLSSCYGIIQLVCVEEDLPWICLICRYLGLGLVLRLSIQNGFVFTQPPFCRPNQNGRWSRGAMHSFSYCEQNFAGGLNLGTFDSCLVVEELAYGCAGIKAALLTSNIGVSPKFLRRNMHVYVGIFKPNCLILLDWTIESRSLPAEPIVCLLTVKRPYEKSSWRSNRPLTSKNSKAPIVFGCPKTGNSGTFLSWLAFLWVVNVPTRFRRVEVNNCIRFLYTKIGVQLSSFLVYRWFSDVFGTLLLVVCATRYTNGALVSRVSETALVY